MSRTKKLEQQKIKKYSQISTVWVLLATLIIPFLFFIGANIKKNHLLNNYGKTDDFLINKKYMDRGYRLTATTYHIAVSSPDKMYKKSTHVTVPYEKWRKLNVGDKVSVTYNPEKISQAELFSTHYSNTENFIGIFLLTIFSAPFAFLSFNYFRGYKKRKNNQYFRKKGAILMFLCFNFSACIFIFLNYWDHLTFFGFNNAVLNTKFGIVFAMGLIWNIFIIAFFAQYLIAVKKLKSKTELLKNGCRISAKIVSVDLTRKHVLSMVYEFNLNQTIFQRKVSGIQFFQGVDFVQEGDVIEVYYQKNNPDNSVWEYE